MYLVVNLRHRLLMPGPEAKTKTTRIAASRLPFVDDATERISPPVRALRFWYRGAVSNYGLQSVR